MSNSTFTLNQGKGEVREEEAVVEKVRNEGSMVPRTNGGTITHAEYYSGEIISRGFSIGHYDHKEIGTLNKYKIVRESRRKSRTLTNIIDTTAIKLAEHRRKNIYRTKLIRDEIARLMNESEPTLVILHGDGRTTAAMEILDILSSDGGTIALILQEPIQWTKVGVDNGYTVLIRYVKQWDPYLDSIVACTKARKVQAILVMSCSKDIEYLMDTKKNTLDSVKHTAVSYAEQYECNVDERLNILRSKQELVGLTNEDLRKIAIQTPPSVFFEYLKACPKSVESAVDFFESPIPLLIEKIASLSRPNAGLLYRELYYVLSEVALSGGELNFNDDFKSYILSKTSRVDSIFKRAVSCSGNMSVSEFLQTKFLKTMKKLALALNLVRTLSSKTRLYIAKLYGNEYVRVDENSKCAFKGQSVFLAVCLTLMHIIPTDFLQNIDISFITRYVRDERYQSNEFEAVFKICSKQFKIIVRRFINEILNGNVRDVMDHPLFDNQEFVDCFFVEIKRNRYMEILTSTETSERNTIIYYGAGKVSTDIVSRICRLKGWKDCSSKSIILRAFRNSSGMHLLVQEQNYKTLLKVSSLGKEEAFQSLIDLGTPVTKSCLLNVVSSGNVQLVRRAISQNHWDTSVLSSALVHACKYCHDTNRVAVVKCLLDKGCNPNEVSDDNLFPVEIALKENDVDLLKLLIDAGADVKVIEEKNYGKHILHDAIEAGNEKIVSILLAQGLDPNARDTLFRTPIHHAVDLQNAAVVISLLEWNADPNLVGRCKRYPLHIACQNTDEDVVIALVQGGANIQFRDGQMCTPLFVASTHMHLGIVKFLQDHGARDKNCTFFAVQMKRMDLLEILKVDFRAKNDLGKTVLEVCIENKHHDITKHFLERRCNVDIITSRGYKLLVFAIIQNDWNLFQTLVNCGAKIQTVDEAGNSALHIACALGHIFIATNILCSYPCLLGALTKIGWTPLHVSAFFGRTKLVELLLGRGADPNTKTKFGETPLCLSRSRRMNCEERERLYESYRIPVESEDNFRHCERILECKYLRKTSTVQAWLDKFAKLKI